MNLQYIAENYVDITDLNENSVIIDAGANIGRFIKDLREFVNCKVYAIEPCRRCIPELSKIENIELINKALVGKDYTGPIKFYQHTNTEGSNIFNNYSGRTRRTYNVDTLGINEIFLELKLKTVDFFKIDIEGEELNVLKNVTLKNALRIKQLSVEVHQFVSLEETMEVLKKLEFEVKNYPRDEGFPLVRAWR
jgi:FkbM family methyltransferase